MNPKSTILLFVFMCTSTVLGAQQQAQITLRDGTVKQVEIKATSTTTLFTDAGNIEFADIKQAAFTEAGKTARVISKLHAAGVPTLVGGQPWQQATLQAPQLTTTGSESPGITTATSPGLDFEKFRKQRDAGKGLQLVGAAALSYSLFASWVNVERTKEAKENNEEPDLIDLSPAIPAIGGAFLTIGILIDVDAGKHLRMRPAY